MTDRISIKQWWFWTTNAKCLKTDCKDQIRSVVREAVDKRLESEVPLGIYLSGGIDSALITALAATSPYRPDDLHTFTMSFEEDVYNEAPLAKLMARRYETIHHVEPTPKICIRDMAQKIVDQYDQPFGDCSAIPTMLLAKMSKDYITVALSGDGGDEGFGGYPRYPMSFGRIEEYVKYVMVWPPRLRKELLNGLWGEELGYISTIGWLAEQSQRYENPDHLNNLMFTDIVTYLPNDIIVKMERATMAHSIENRCPLLDASVLDLSLRIPSYKKCMGTLTKLVLKSAFEDVIPDEILAAPKHGFGIPITEWLREGEGLKLLHETLLNPPCSLFNIETVKRVVSMNQYQSFGHGLWILIMLSMWWKKHFGG